MSGPGIWLAFLCAANAVNGISATSAVEIHVWVAWSKIASVYCTDALAAVRKPRTNWVGAKVLLGEDSAFYGHGPVGAAIRAGAQVSVTVRLDPKVKH